MTRTVEAEEVPGSPSAELAASMEEELRRYGLRAIALCFFKLGSPAASVVRTINVAFGEGTVAGRTVRHWFEKFGAGNESIKGKESKGQRDVPDISILKDIIESNPQISTRDIATFMGRSTASISKYLASLGVARTLGRWIPAEPSEESQLFRVQVSEWLLARMDGQSFLPNVVMGDERFFFYRTKSPVTGTDAEEGEVLCPGTKKLVFAVWWTRAGVAHHALLAPEERVDADKYFHELEVMTDKLYRQMPQLEQTEQPILIQRDTRPYSFSRDSKSYLRQMGYEVLPYPHHSPDLLPSDYHFFRAMSDAQKEKVFPGKKAVADFVEKFLEEQPLSFFEDGIDSLPAVWRQCSLARGMYFKKEN